MVKYLGSKSVAERESSVSGGSGKSNERAKLLLLSPPLPQHPEKNFRSVSSLPVSHFQDSQKIDLLTPFFNFPELRVKELYFIEKNNQEMRYFMCAKVFHKNPNMSLSLRTRPPQKKTKLDSQLPSLISLFIFV